LGALLLTLNCQFVSGVTDLQVEARPLGSGCEQSLQCESGFCVDGFCCDQACEGDCRSCNQSGTTGVCTFAASATNPGDECGHTGSCDGNGRCASGAPIWSKSFGDEDMQIAGDVAIGEDDHILTVGAFGSSIDFSNGQTPLQSAGGFDIYVAEFDADGNHLWSKAFGDGEADRAQQVKVDQTGNVLLAGAFAGDLDFYDGSKLEAGSSGGVFVAELDTNGIGAWSRGFAGFQLLGTTEGGFAGRIRMATDGSSGVYLTGSYKGTAKFDSFTLTSTGDEDIFVAKLDASSPGHDTVWAKGFESGIVPVDPIQTPYVVAAIDVDEAGNVYLVGNFASTLALDENTTLTRGPDSWYDAFVLKMSSQGDLLWVKQLTGAGPQFITSVTSDVAGQIIVTGGFGINLNYGTTAIEPPEGANPAGLHLFIMRLAPGDGSLQWHAVYAGSPQAPTVVDEHPTFPIRIIADNVGNMILVGPLTNDVDFGGGALVNSGSYDLFFAKVSSDGQHLFSKRYGDTALQAPAGAAPDSTGAFVITGTFVGTLVFGGNVLTASKATYGNPTTDVFLAKFEP